MAPSQLRLAILAITMQHYTIYDIFNWSSFRKGMKQNINKLEQTTGKHNNCSVSLTSSNTLLRIQVLLAFLLSSLKTKHSNNHWDDFEPTAALQHLLM